MEGTVMKIPHGKPRHGSKDIVKTEPEDVRFEDVN
jgi:uncharacterized protein YcnI